MSERNRVFKNDQGEWAVTTEIAIAAPPERVWAVLTDFASMPEWSSNLQGIEGDFRDGGRITAHFKVGSRLRSFEHPSIRVEPGRSFEWSDRYAPGLRDHHVYLVADAPNGGSRFVQTDVARGPLGRLFGRRIMEATQRNYERFNRELKTRVEDGDV